MTKKLRLLFVSAGTVVGQKILATFEGRREGLELVGTSSVANEPSLFEFDRIHLVPPTLEDPARFERQLLEIVDRERPDLVIPCRDDDVVFLAGLRDRRPDLARHLLCGNAATARVVRDKWLSHRFCSERGLPFVPSIVGGDSDRAAAFVRANGFPLVSKPRRGFSAQGIHLLFDVRQFERALGNEDLVVQAFLGDPTRVSDFLAELDERGIPLFHTLQGLKHSIQALVGPEGKVARVICTRNLRAERRSKWVEADDDPATQAMGRLIAEAFAAEGWRGPLNIQCQRAGDGRLLVHEFNGRFTGATSDRWMLGFDEVGETIELYTGFRFAPATARTASREVFESMVARAADPSDVDVLVRDGVWSATVAR